MKNTLRIIFFGTPAFATGVLKTLHESPYEIAAVVTAPDKPAGRGRTLQQSDVKTYALQAGLKVLQPTNLKDNLFLEELRALQANLQVIVAFRMLPEQVWNMPALGTFNLHASLLPRYRGAAPINWAICNGDTETGVTTFFIDNKIDTGAIIAQKRLPIATDETAGSLYEKLMHLGAALTLETIDAIAAGTVTTTAQADNEAVTQAPKLTNENTTINWNLPATAIDAFVRGMYPYPVAKAMLVQKEMAVIKIFKTVVIDKEHEVTPGTLIIDENRMLVACKTGFIELLSLQLPNKKQMHAKELLNGYTFHADAYFATAPLKTA